MIRPAASHLHPAVASSSQRQGGHGKSPLRATCITPEPRVYWSVLIHAYLDELHEGERMIALIKSKRSIDIGDDRQLQVIRAGRCEIGARLAAAIHALGGIAGEW
ncbi:hypothetical protein PQR62_20380 [Herbaspirillum lusitanum]|uniref:Uncharacterized protein n=1 Tax=Herbaspirillum lusitanum TaxID=213312 RepID=A0ABW9AEG4_9BURK